MENNKVKNEFLLELKKFANTLAEQISKGNEWTIRGFIDIFQKVHMVNILLIGQVQRTFNII